MFNMENSIFFHRLNLINISKHIMVLIFTKNLTQKCKDTAKTGVVEQSKRVY